MSNATFSADLIQLQIEATTKEEVIKILSDKLYAQGFTKDTFFENVLKREEECPTGLPTIIPMAICHTEAEHVNESAIAFGNLVNPIAFHEMGSLENDVMAEMLFVMAIKNPKDQIPLLKKMMQLFQDEETLITLRDADNVEELVEYLNNIFS